MVTVRLVGLLPMKRWRVAALRVSRYRLALSTYGPVHQKSPKKFA